MHDTTQLEELGIPSVFVATTEFEHAAQVQSRSLGSDPAAVFIAHPIQDRTDDELRQLADGAVERLVSALTQS